MMRPTIKQTSAEKVFRYFFGDTWKKYPVIELAIRAGANKINFFDDELYVWNGKVFKTFNWNADPSAYRIGGESIAILRTGVHFYTISYHHIGEPAKRYVALRPNTPGNAVPVWRMDAAGKLHISTGYALNQHAGGDRTTGSRGCQTAPRAQYPEFITFIGNALGVKIPLGVQHTAEQRFMKGVGNIPYVLVTQAQFDYIQNLPEMEFDSPADLKYQLQNFVNVPKIETVKPTVALSPDAPRVITNLEAEAKSDSEIDAENVGSRIDDLTISAAVPADKPTQTNLPTVEKSDDQTVSNEQPPITTAQTTIVDKFNEYGDKATEISTKVQTVSDTVSNVSQSSWAVSILKGIGGWALMAWAVFKDNLVEILIAAVIIVAVIWFIKQSKDRANERTVAALKK